MRCGKYGGLGALLSACSGVFRGLVYNGGHVECVCGNFGRLWSVWKVWYIVEGLEDWVDCGVCGRLGIECGLCAGALGRLILFL